MSPKQRILLTGFEPFGGDAVNPSQLVVERLVAEGVRGVVLPVEFHRALEVLDDAIERHRPHTVVALGLGASRTELSVERLAVNLDDARIADNAGRQPLDVPVVEGGPTAYFSSLPVKAVVAALQAQGLPASLSWSAGSFVCNHVFYGLAHRVAQGGALRRAGFIHLPSLATMPIESMVAGVRIALAACSTHERDLCVAGGVID